ncbi:acetyl/propionyl/methylcrotonyl-CoA carboxylase subunit alpha [Pacificimonas flava]|uniref:Methylcrotonyl-CoA carboxylase biotin-containing subunit n=1 Tax=Pacificimonas flava TaxID=1234595 RepID=M2U988_9SPHN|nr:acetyl/propionyl/methylcrotonyl-CoA carboxylase subunit alpha [Pacificimonas flava]EMD84558.1 Methylcrotonyl-CoA carboxylase biotin-containing subunit [Pacificimonas flava]MBB5279572.1 3-methylcrotonyl-CoA carboxylase alpha subunit [Pacificimonas flava]
MRKLLIANRGEIARRVIRTARRMGIETVAVYSDADRDAPHVRDADEAVHIGPAPAAESYLRIDRIVDAARRTGADAVHPGYGFLSENAAFARALSEAGILFVGPKATSIERMGLKDAAKALMKKAGVPVTPGYQGEDQSLQRLEKAAQSVGYPLLIKAVAGGGGKGMRRVDSEAEFADALIAAKREGEASFGNDNVLIERLIQRPRHVEVQVFGDAKGNVVHLFERDCSLQRRHQKVVEEAPAPGLSPRTRQALGEAAVRAAKAIDYLGAGTIEFILDTETTDENGDNPFYFMEMNTRLQVEHPVTELITGTDLVEWQIRVARGESLPKCQEELSVSGHAVEARLYAEDPATGFLPSTGPLDRLDFPRESGGVRIDSGVEEGGAVTVHYDPMIAKVIACGPSRDAAIDRLVSALDATIVEGVKTNRAFLARLIDDGEFRSGAVHTGLIEQRLEALTELPDASGPAAAVAALALTLPRGKADAPTLFSDFPGWRMNLPARRYVDLFPEDGEPMHLMLERADGGYRVSGCDSSEMLSGRWRDDTHIEAVVDGTPMLAIVVFDEDSLEVRIGGEARRYGTSAAAVEGPAGGDGSVVAPMPGRVLNLFVENGKMVEAGERLLVLEAMKMENRLTAPIGGRVVDLSITEGNQVSEGAVLLTIEPAD